MRSHTYGPGERIVVGVEFDRAVKATGSPQVALTIGAETRHAALSSKWGSRELYFEYTVQDGDRDDDGITIPPNALLLNGGTITAADGTTDADLTHAAVAPFLDRKVDGGRATP